MSPTITSTMNPSTSLQIPDTSAVASSRQYGASRPVSVTVHAAGASSSQPSSRKRASHAVQSSHQHHQQQIDDHSGYHDVNSHPAAVAYAAAHPRRTIPKFGPYLLLQTLGEGEFGKVKLGLHSQWGEEVAVKLIKRGNIDSTVRMSKVEREIEVLRTLKHPNIVRLYDVIETDKYIGIILEYASGGELFDHILAHRYLREKDAAKLFSQLISGVWYIHQKKIVHRDLKLENLLLDRHRNVIITDFGFANRFEHRADDLMQTSCGSPCYAAPELVISEGLYVGSAVDIWSCGVILYAMLAGYLPFDDDPANPDGDNINLLYKYIVNTPLSFPEYVSTEARDLLSMMLVPEPTRRADLLAVMAHPWLAAYAPMFSRSVDDLERAAMEQHQMKRLAYQRQMKQVAAAAESQTKVSRSQSARMDLYHPGGATSTSRSRSYKDPSTQPDYLMYETSADQTFSSQIVPVGGSTAHQKNFNSAALLPSSALDDDPFASASSRDPDTAKPLPPPSAEAIAVDGVVARRDSRARRDSKDGNGQVRPGSSKGSTATPTQNLVKDSPGSSGKGGFRHTIQVEYGEPNGQKAGRSATQSPQKATSPKRDSEDMPKRPSEDRASRARTTSHVTSHNGPSSPPHERPRKASQGNSKPLPIAPSSTSPASSRSRPERTTPTSPRPPHPETSVAPVTVSSSPANSVPAAAEKSLQTMRSASGSTGSQSSKQSQHRKGLSFDKLGISKIFGSGSANDQNGAVSRVPSEASGTGLAITTDLSSSKLNLNQNPEAVQPASAHAGSKTSLLSPGEGGRKNRRNTLTVMVEPITRSIKSRSKVRGATNKEKAEVAPPPHSALPSTASLATEDPPVPPFGSVSRTEIGLGPGMQASTSKARKVMQWFRTKSKGRESFGLPDDSLTGDESEKPSGYNRKNPASASSATISQTLSPVQVVVTSPEHPRTPRAPGHPHRSASSATDSSFSPHSIAARIRNSVGVGVPAPAKGVLRIHHGAVDQTTITTRAPPEVMKHVREVLEGMGVEIQVESDYKYRCIRPKRRKTPSFGLGFRDVSGNGGSFAAITMVGSAASNGVDKRGLPVPSQSFHGTGGMLRGLLMRRQSSQVSASGMGSQPSLPLEDDTTSPTISPLVSEPPTIPDPVYGDTTQDAGDEVRFSVELTRLDRLNDTFSLDIRRLKGNLRSYKFLYDSLRERADLQR